MYKCSECEKEFVIKPDYCDCGNDVFLEIIPKVPNTMSALSGTRHSQKSNNFLTMLKKRLERRNISVFACSFFITCLFFSLLVLFLNVETSQKNIDGSENKNVKKQLIPNIPSIDQIWDSTPPNDTTTIKNVVTQTSAPNSVVSSQTIRPKSSVISKKVTNDVVSSGAKTTVNKTPKTSQSKVVQAKTTQVSQIKNAAVSSVPKPATKPTTSTAVKSTPHSSVQKTVAKVQTIQNDFQINTEEMNNYKISLRSALFSKLAVADIQGRGKCGIEFTIDSTGKLTNRAFTFQSDNKSLNDEVYRMMMRLPQYYPPPDSYKGEKIKMTFTFDYGNYRVDYTN